MKKSQYMIWQRQPPAQPLEILKWRNWIDGDIDLYAYLASSLYKETCIEPPTIPSQLPFVKVNT